MSLGGRREVGAGEASSLFVGKSHVYFNSYFPSVLKYIVYLLIAVVDKSRELIWLERCMQTKISIF